MKRFTQCPTWAWMIPPLLLSCLVFTLAVDVLHWDEWVIWGELLHKIESGTFNLSDLFAQQNEQRNLAARTFGLLLMPFFKLNRFAEYGLNIVLAGVGFLAAVRLYSKTGNTTPPNIIWLIFSMFSFSIMQWEAFTFGSNSSVIILPVSIWSGLLIAHAGPPTTTRLITLGLIGILPSFSFANGLFYWVSLVPVLGFQAHKHNKISLVSSVWTGMTCTAWFLYFINFASPEHHPSLLSGLTHPLKLAGYFFAYLGGAVSSDKNLFVIAIMLGLASFPLLTAMVWREWKAGNKRRELMLPWLGAATFSLCSAAVTAIARCNFGVEQALESRYASFSTPYWMALVALFFMTWDKRPKNNPLFSPSKILLAASLVVFILSTVLSTIVVYNRHDRFVRARDALFELSDEAALKTIFPDTAYLMMQLPLLMKKRLSIYRDLKQFEAFEEQAGIGGKFSISNKYNAAEKRIPGFMVQGVLNNSDGAILFTVDKTVIGYLPKPSQNWKIFIPCANFPIKQGQLKAFVTTKQGGNLVKLAPAEGISFRIEDLQPVNYTINKYFFTH